MSQTDYNPSFFIPQDPEHARSIMLDSEDSDIPHRWKRETEWIMETSRIFMDITADSTILDWGCGVGRISKELIDTYGCKVIGVDLQPKMLEYAVTYVDSDRFSVIQYQDIFTKMPKQFFTHVFACWVFQYSNKIQYEIPIIYDSMKFDSNLFVIEVDKKTIPNTNGGYFDDGTSSRLVLEKYYDMEILGKIPLTYTTNKIKKMSWWAILNRKLRV